MNVSAIDLAIDPSPNEESKPNVSINSEDFSAVRDDSHVSLGGNWNMEQSIRRDPKWV